MFKLGFVLSWVGLIAAGAVSGTGDAKQVAEGKRLYGMYCAACHGKQGRGNGPTAKLLKARPSNLTRLQRDHAGTFPARKVYHAIDGRGIEHGTREMPLWGLAFQEWGLDTNQEADIQARIDQLVAWIRSVQQE